MRTKITTEMVLVLILLSVFLSLLEIRPIQAPYTVNSEIPPPPEPPPPDSMEDKIAYATIDIIPNTLNLKAKGHWITSYIEFYRGYSVSDIDLSSILLNDSVPADLSVCAQIGDHDNDSVPDLMVRFDRARIILLINEYGTDQDAAILSLNGKLYDGTLFEGTYIVLVK